MVGIADLANNIAGSVRGVGQTLGLIAPSSRPFYRAYPEKGIPQEFQKEQWFKNPSIGLYAFAVLDVGDAIPGTTGNDAFVKQITNLFTPDQNTRNSFSDFNLPITPQEITQTEDFAVSIKPTQGGTVVQHSGNKYKTLTVSGTTGVHPFKGSSGADRLTGGTIAAPDELKYRSGYEVFLHFRAWIKSYHETKAQGSEFKSLRMIFKNYKDWEFSYVEPIKFTMKRDASKPLLYNYTIQFRVLGAVAPPKPELNFLQELDKHLDTAAVVLERGRGILLKQQELIRSTAGAVQGALENVRRLTLAIKAARGIPLTMRDVSSQINKNFVSQRDALTLMAKMGQTSKSLADDSRSFESSGRDLSTTPDDPKTFGDDLEKSTKKNGQGLKDPKASFQAALTSLGDAANDIGIEDYPTAAQTAIKEEQVNAALISRAEIEDIRDNLMDLQNKFAQAIGLSDSTYNEVFGIIEETQSETTTAEITDAQHEVMYGFAQIDRAISQMLSSDELFDTNEELFNVRNSSNGPDSIGTGIFSFPDADGGVKEGIVPYGATLEDIALSELGDASRWTELAELNNLKAPYIVDDPDTDFTITYRVRSDKFSDPVNIQDLSIGYLFTVNGLATASGAWIGKEDNIAEYLGGDKTLASSWKFLVPPNQSTEYIISTGEIHQYHEGVGWDHETDISESLQADGVLRPGDKILIPQTQATPPETRIRGPRDNYITNDLTNSEKALAVDLRLTETGDLDLTPSGDLNLAYGVDNGAQAIVLKLLYGKGSLKKFPTIGTNINVGGKLPDIADLRNQVYTSLIQDERIDDVTRINIRQVNSAIELSFEVRFKDIQDPVPISIPV